MQREVAVPVPRWFRLTARIRATAQQVGFAVFAVGWLLLQFVPKEQVPRSVSLAVIVVGMLGMISGFAFGFFPAVPKCRPVPVASPVLGRWSAANSPASNRPSHGIHTYGQTFAIDLVYEPYPGARPAFGKGPTFRPPTDFPAFGQPVNAPADGTVVGIRNGMRDHRSRSTWAGVGYLYIEGMLREPGGTRFVAGNYIVLDLGGGVYALLAHLQRGSVEVRLGQRVRRGERLARCGNSGNSTEPHLHFQLMDHRRPLVAAGVPFIFNDVSINGGPVCAAVPKNDQVMVAANALADQSQGSG